MADTSDLRFNEIGGLIEIDLNEDVSGGSVYKIVYEKPLGQTGVWAGAISDASGSALANEGVMYTTSDGDLDQHGTWKIQAYLELSGGYKAYSTIVEIEIGKRLYDAAA